MKKISVKVIPRASRNQIEKQPDGSYRVYLTVAPVDGLANEKLIELMSDEIGVSKSRLCIVRGHKSRMKIVKIVE